MGKKDYSFSKLNSDEKLDKLYSMMCNIQSVAKQSNDNIKKLTKRVQAIDLRVDNIEQKLKSTNNKSNMVDGAMKNMQHKINELQQAKFECDMIIRGIPEIESDEQSLLTIVQIIIDKLNCDKPYNILSIYRVGKANVNKNNKSPRLLNVQFEHKNQKANILEAKKKVKICCDQIKLEDKPIGTSDQIVYFDERLTKETSDLYFDARQLRNQQLLKYVWVHNGAVFVKENDEAKTIRVRDQQQLSIFKKGSKHSSTRNDGSDQGADSGSSSQSSDDDDDDASSDNEYEEAANTISSPSLKGKSKSNATKKNVDQLYRRSTRSKKKAH